MITLQQLLTLQEDVIQLWESEGEDCFITETLGFPEMPVQETYLNPDAFEILANPDQCANELGFDNVEDYLETRDAYGN